MNTETNLPAVFRHQDAQPKAGLPLALEYAVQYALERRWYDTLDASSLSFRRGRGGDPRSDARFLRIMELAHGVDIVQSLHLLNMQNVLSSFRDGSHSLLFALRGEHERVGMYLGVRRFAATPETEPGDYVQVLQRALRSNFPGIVLSTSPVPYEECQSEILDPLTEGEFRACVTGTPSIKKDAAGRYMQSLDRLVDALRGESYLLLVLAEPIMERDLLEAISRCHQLSGEIHTLVRRSVGASRSEASGESAGKSRTGSFGFGFPLLNMVFGLSVDASRTDTVTTQETETLGSSENRELLNKTAEYCERLLNSHLERLQQGRSLGFWNVGFYLAGDKKETFLRMQGLVRGVFSGQETYLEPLRVLDLSNAPGEVRQVLRLLRNPEMDLGGLYHPFGDPFQQMATPLTASELSILLGLPHREVPGVKLTPVADFGLNPPPAADGLVLGHVLYRGDTLAQELAIPLRKLTQHAFVTGITGAGKTNTCLVLLKEAYRRGVPFMVIEPAKTEYRSLLEDRDLGPHLWTFTLGEEGVAASPFRLNPFEFARGFPLLTHIDLLKAVFNAAFPMYASMPYILEEAILEVYTERGWNIARSENAYAPGNADFGDYLPRLEDLYLKVDEVVARKKYDPRVSMDITAALKSRLQSLMVGGKGMMLNVPRSIPFEQLLAHPTVLELRRVGDDDEKAFVMALLLIRLYEQCEVGQSSPDLKHLTLIEEAHRLLRNVPVVASMESANPRGKAVEMFTDILAEVRTYGEGIIIVDQVPAKLSPDVVKNTNLKVLHRLVAQDDRDFVGNAMNLTPFQKEHVVRLRPGQAVVHSEGLDTPVLVQVNSLKDDLQQRAAGSDVRGQTLGERMQRVRHEVPQAFQRYVACSACAAPCTCFSEQGGPTRQARSAYRRLDAALRLSPLQGIIKVWMETSGALRRGLSRRLGTPDPLAGELYCHLVRLVEAQARTAFGFYRYGGNTYAGVVYTQRALAGLLSALLDGAAPEVLVLAVKAYRQALAKWLATAPARPRPGCRLCQRHCAYGLDVQPVPATQAEGLAQTIAAASKAPQQIDMLCQLAEEHAVRFAGVPLEPQQLPHLAYCWLCNATDELEILRPFQARALARGKMIKEG